MSLNDNYTACSSVYGGGAGSPAAVEGSKPSTSSSAVSGGSNCGASSDALSSDLRPAKIGRMVPAAAAVAAAPMGGKTTTVSKHKGYNYRTISAACDSSFDC